MFTGIFTMHYPVEIFTCLLAYLPCIILWRYSHVYWHIYHALSCGDIHMFTGIFTMHYPVEIFTCLLAYLPCIILWRYSHVYWHFYHAQLQCNVNANLHAFVFILLTSCFIFMKFTVFELFGSDKLNTFTIIFHWGVYEILHILVINYEDMFCSTQCRLSIVCCLNACNMHM